MNTRQKISIGDVEYDSGSYRSSLLIASDEHGNLGPGKMIETQYECLVDDFRVDICNDVIFGGNFTGIGFFENDTLIMNDKDYREGFIGKYLRSSGYSLNIGKDTAIGLSHSIEIAANPGYTKYL